MRSTRRSRRSSRRAATRIAPGKPPRQSDPAIDKALAVIFGASDLAAEPLAPAEIDKALAWLKAADRIGAVYLLAGTGYDDFAKVPQSAALQRRMRGNVSAFADEFGRYADFQMVLLAAVANAQMRAHRQPRQDRRVAGQCRRDQGAAVQAIRSNLIALVYDGHNDGWRMARLTALGRTAPVAAKFLSKDDAQAVRGLALQTVDYFKDVTCAQRCGTWRRCCRRLYPTSLVPRQCRKPKTSCAGMRAPAPLPLSVLALKCAP